MLLDSGIYTAFSVLNGAKPGEMPKRMYAKKACGWYGVKDFSSSPTYLQNEKKSVTVAVKIRIIMNIHVTNHDVIVLSDVATMPEDCTVYEVVRVWHGADEESGLPISDIDLEVVRA